MSPTLALLLDRDGIPDAPPAGEHPHVFIAAQSGLRVVLPFAPREADYGGWAPKFTALSRPGRKPLLKRTEDDRGVMAFDVDVVRAGQQVPVGDVLGGLVNLAKSGEVMTVAYNGASVGAWRLTACTIRSRQLQHGTNAITRATASLSFTEATDAPQATGPLTGGAAAPKAAAPAASAGPAPRRYTVRKGDTLSGIAKATYGNPNRWPEIAKASGVSDPRKLKVGQVLTLP